MVRTSRRTVLAQVSALVCAALASLAGCGNNTGGSNTGNTTGTNGTNSTNTSNAATIKIGHYASLTGSESTFGVSTDNGIKLAIDEINAAGGVLGRQLELITYDNQGKPNETATVVTRLCTQDHVTALIGEVASGRSMIGAPIAQRYGVPMISPSSTNPDVTREGDMIFRVCFIDPFQGLVCAKFANERGWQRAAVLFNREAPYSTGLADNFKSAFTELGGTIVTEQAYAAGDPDFGAQITAIANSEADVIFIPGYYTEVGAIARQVRARGITAPMLGGDGWDSAELANTAGEAINGSFFSNHYSHEETREAVQTFVSKYQERFGAVPDGLAALGYDALLITVDAIKRANSTDGAAIAAALAATQNFPAVTGNITIDADRNASKSAVILELRDGAQHYVTTIAPD